jgi:hypothetical protein
MIVRVSVDYATGVPFVSACPRCGSDRAQWYTHIALKVMLRRGQPVQGYCGPCQEFWQLSADERNDLASKLTN